MKHLIVLLSLLVIISCDTKNKTANTFKVDYKGALKTIMHKADVSAKTDLKDYKEKTHLYAIGAIENLKGEIQIFDSKPYNTLVSDSTLTFDNSYDRKATLLVYASVSKWISVPIPETVNTYEQLETYVAQAAKTHQINIKEPFPFLIEGTPKSFNWHVINWKNGDTEHSHEKHVNSGLHGTIQNKAVTMLGFYSDSHHAIFTHHTTNMHIHVKTNDNKIAGHVDGLLFDKGMVLKIPDIN
jgi:acetolactate decarboxylase